MAFKPNYKMQRAERDRAKQAKKQEKLKQRQEEAAQRKVESDGAPVSDADETS